MESAPGAGWGGARKAAEWEAELKNFEARWFVEHPLSDQTIAALHSALRDGIFFCCDDGRARLSEIVDDPIWVERLNSWAYEALSCRGSWARDYEGAIRKLDEHLAAPYTP